MKTRMTTLILLLSISALSCGAASGEPSAERSAETRGVWVDRSRVYSLDSIQVLRELCESDWDTVFDEDAQECQCREAGTQFRAEVSDWGYVSAHCDSVKPEQSLWEEFGSLAFKNGDSFISLGLPWAQTKEQRAGIELNTFHPYLPPAPRGDNSGAPAISSTFHLSVGTDAQLRFADNTLYAHDPVRDLLEFGTPQIMNPPKHAQVVRHDHRLSFVEADSWLWRQALGARDFLTLLPEFDRARFYYTAIPKFAFFPDQDTLEIAEFVARSVLELRTVEKEAMPWKGESVAFESRMDLGCLSACKITRPLLASSEPNGFRSEIQKNYLKGARRMESLWIYRGPDVAAVSVLNPGRGISHTLIFTHTVHPNGNLTARTQVFDRYWRNVFGSGLDPEARFWEESANLSVDREMVRHAPKQSNGLGVLICDSAVRPLQIKFGRAIAGPYASDRPDARGSLWGWLPNADASLKDYANGAYSADPVYIPGAWSASETHGNAVASVLFAQNEKQQAAFMDSAQCLGASGQWASAVENAKIKTILLSGAEHFEKGQCARFTQETFGPAGHGRGFLWVIAAGNSRREGGDPLSCPQNLGQAPNRIIVAATRSDGSLAAESDFGVAYADVAADGRSAQPKPDEPSLTSFSAPRVASHATQLFAEFDDLSVEEAKWAIVLSSRLQERTRRSKTLWVPLPVRSGGSIDLERSRKTAKKIAALSEHDRADLRASSGKISERLLATLTAWMDNGEFVEKRKALQAGGYLK